MKPAASKPLRVLIVEDEALIRMLFEDMLDELGHAVEGAVGHIDEALEIARSCPCDVAILDVHLNGKEVYPVAEVLAERGIPFLFATGLSGSEFPQKFRDRPTMQKPFEPDRLQEILMQITSN